MVSYLWYIGGSIFLLFVILAKMYRIVPADYVDVVIQSGTVKIYSTHKEYSTEGKSAYFAIPSWFFILKLGMEIRRIPLNVITIDVPNFLTFDKDRARFVCDIMTYVVVKDPLVAAKRFSGDLSKLTSQVALIVQSTTRDITTKKTIREVINNRQDIIDGITPILSQGLETWGVELKSVELIDFKDPDPSKDKIESHVIQDISSIIEEQISSEATQKNAEQKKIARLRVAEAEEEARKREIAKDQVIAEREQEKDRKVFEQAKTTKEKELEVMQVQQVKTADIAKEKALVEAKQRKEVEEINKEQQKLKGEGERAYLEEKAKGDAAAVKEKLLAEAEGKDKLQEALNKFSAEAIRALTAEQVVNAQKEIGIAAAKALEHADMKVFVGSDAGGGFDIGKAIEATKVSSGSTAKSILNALGRPNDLGFQQLPESSNEEHKTETTATSVDVKAEKKEVKPEAPRPTGVPVKK